MNVRIEVVCVSADGSELRRQMPGFERHSWLVRINRADSRTPSRVRRDECIMRCDLDHK